MRSMNENEEQRSPVERVSKAVGAGFSKERRDEVYFGKPPGDTYFGFNKDLVNIHDVRVNKEAVKRLHGMAMGEQVASARSQVDSKAGLVKELVNETHMTRKEAEELVKRWMDDNDLIEVDDPVLGKYIAPRGSR